MRYYFKEYYENDFKAVTKMLRTCAVRREFNNTIISYQYYNHDTGEFDEVVLWNKNAELILNQRLQKREGTFKLKYEKKEIKKSLLAEVNEFEKYVYSDNNNAFVKLAVTPSKLSDYKLAQYFRV